MLFIQLGPICEVKKCEIVSPFVNKWDSLNSCSLQKKICQLAKLQVTAKIEINTKQKKNAESRSKPFAQKSKLLKEMLSRLLFESITGH